MTLTHDELVKMIVENPTWFWELVAKRGITKPELKALKEAETYFDGANIEIAEAMFLQEPLKMNPVQQILEYIHTESLGCSEEQKDVLANVEDFIHNIVLKGNPQ